MKPARQQVYGSILLAVIVMIVLLARLVRVWPFLSHK
jgi:hypothetical protein